MIGDVLLGVWLGGWIMAIAWSLSEAKDNGDPVVLWEHLWATALWPLFIVWEWNQDRKN